MQATRSLEGPQTAGRITCQGTSAAAAARAYPGRCPVLRPSRRFPLIGVQDILDVLDADQRFTYANACALETRQRQVGQVLGLGRRLADPAATGRDRHSSARVPSAGDVLRLVMVCLLCSGLHSMCTRPTHQQISALCLPPRSAAERGFAKRLWLWYPFIRPAAKVGHYRAR